MQKKRRHLFTCEGPWELGACVGTNGIQDDHEYARGYAEVPEIILEHIINNNNLGLDTLVYPLLFSARHSVELYLKESIRVLNEIRIKDQQIQRFIESTHSVKDLFLKVTEQANHTDRRFHYDLEKIRPRITAVS